jgi:hypothetical protein
MIPDEMRKKKELENDQEGGKSEDAQGKKDAQNGGRKAAEPGSKVDG